MATITKYCIVDKVGICQTEAYVVLGEWIFDTQTQAHEALHKSAYFSMYPDKYKIAKIEYEDN